MKPGTGSVDAPRAFSLKLKQVTDSLGMKSCTIDPELCIMHFQENNKPAATDARARTGRIQSAAGNTSRSSMDTLVALITKHADNFKVCGVKGTGT